MRKLSRVLILFALVLSHIMCVVVTYNYRGLICSIEHQGFSAPAQTAFFLAVPFAVGISLCLVFAYLIKNFNSRS